jgi:S-formylglutathione hydrolase FrmB
MKSATLRLNLPILLAMGVLLGACEQGQEPAPRPVPPGAAPVPAGAVGRLSFRITLDEELAPTGASGRLLVFMSSAEKPKKSLGTGFIPGGTWLAAVELTDLGAGETLVFDPDALAYPEPFSAAAPGNYQVMALLDVDHSYAYSGEGPGDLKSGVLAVANLDPAATAPVDLKLSKANPLEPAPTDTENIKLVEFTSPALSAFWGRPIQMQAGVVLPPGYAESADKRYATVYHLHGFSGDHREAWGKGAVVSKAMGEGRMAPMIHVFLNASCPGGAHQFADSANNGPWGRALTEEFIPNLEGRFRTAGLAGGRFLTGHSSGGWSSLWLQITYPEYFGGTWSTAPDPVDLRSWTGIDATPGTRDNAYHEPDGRPKQLVRNGSDWVASIRQFAGQEEVAGEYGGQFASFEWVWSPRGADGRPMKLFNRRSGVLNPEVVAAWQRYDIRLILETNWPILEQKLKGKIHVFCGELDTFRLEEGVRMLAEFFAAKGSDAVCEIVPGRGHGDLYQPYETFPQGLAMRIDQEMATAFAAAMESSAKPAAPR